MANFRTPRLDHGASNMAVRPFVVFIIAGVPWVVFPQCGSRCVEVVDRLPSKLLLILFIDALILIGLLEYYLVFGPYSALRSTRSCLRLCKMCLAAGIIMPLGLFIAGTTELFGGIVFMRALKMLGGRLLQT